MEDIREKPVVRHEDILALNFIRDRGAYVFRRHHRNGLRSHIMEVLSVADVRNETRGVTVDGIRRFPRARPLKMLRVFRRYFENLAHAMEEIQRFKTVANYLPPAHLAMSQEFLVEYRFGEKSEILLCGLQEYVIGESLDPWTSMDRGYLQLLVHRLISSSNRSDGLSRDRMIEKIRENTESFVKKIKTMIMEVNHVPDLAGVRNILVTGRGEVKLVDINNISVISADGRMPKDDIGYPVCDKSIEALSLIEEKILGREIDPVDPVYVRFFQVDRRREIHLLDSRFHRDILMETLG